MRLWTCMLILCSISVLATKDDNSEWLNVKIEQGTVRGHRDSSEKLWTFLNVPYATAPTDKHKFKNKPRERPETLVVNEDLKVIVKADPSQSYRTTSELSAGFRAPLPPPQWSEPYDAVDKGIICPQFNFKPFIPEYLVMQEDCLVANIYVPTNARKNLSVLVYIHGGGFQIGYGDWLTAKNLLKYEDLLVVTFNYRLGLHGFLCLGTEDVPGNAGMKDQVALLKWVQQNIAAFGGNPDDVTVAGYSSGSMSVDLLTISKAAVGLFHKVIPESGSNLGPFTCQTDPLQNAKDYAKTLNFTNVDDFYALEEFYKTLSHEALLGDGFKDDATYEFSPCVERDTGDGAFLTESPFSILKRGDIKKLPVLYGYSDMEGLLRIALFDEVWKVRMNEKFSDFLPIDLRFETEEEKEKVAKEVKEFYFGDKPIDKDNVLSYVDFHSDTYFVHSSLWSVKLYLEAGHNQIYLYEYSFTDEDTPVVIHTDVRGATHCAQTYAVLDGKSLADSNEDDITDEYRNMKKVMRELWHNFIKTGKPVPEGSSLPEWPPVGADRSPHMSLGQPVVLRSVLADPRTNFWEKIYSKYYKAPIPPPTPPNNTRAHLIF